MIKERQAKTTQSHPSTQGDLSPSNETKEAPIDAQEAFIERFQDYRFNRHGFVLFPIEFYIDDPIFFFLQILCFLRGHRMERQEIGQHPGSPSPVGIYACSTCGQCLHIELEGEELRKYARVGMENFPSKTET